MKTVLKYIAAVAFSILAAIQLWLALHITEWQAGVISKERPSDILNEEQFATAFPFSFFVNSNAGFVDLLSSLPVICLIGSLILFVRKHLIWGAAMAAFPSILILPLFIGVELEWRGFVGSFDTSMKDALEDF